MQTLKIDALTDFEGAVSRAAGLIKDGGVVALPTETVYGLAASALDDSAIKKVFIAKGRPQDNPLIVHISDEKMLGLVAEDIPECLSALAKKFWPGPLTVILKKKAGYICDSVSAGLDTVAVRMPDNEIALEIIRRAGVPIAAPSANISGYPSPTSAKHVFDDLDGKIDAIVMGDDCRVGVESTVVSLCSTPSILRPGAVTAEQLREFLPDIAVDKAVLSQLNEGERVASPGMKYKHYSPLTEVVLVEGSGDAYRDFVNAKDDGVAVCFSEDEGIIIPKMIYGSAKDELSLAHNIFDTLRRLDNCGFGVAYVHAPSKEGVGLAVYNRLIRAAAFKVVSL